GEFADWLHCNFLIFLWGLFFPRWSLGQNLYPEVVFPDRLDDPLHVDLATVGLHPEDLVAILQIEVPPALRKSVLQDPQKVPCIFRIFDIGFEHFHHPIRSFGASPLRPRPELGEISLPHSVGSCPVWLSIPGAPSRAVS